jgi:hypothetical protein
VTVRAQVSSVPGLSPHCCSLCRRQRRKASGKAARTSHPLPPPSGKRCERRAHPRLPRLMCALLPAISGSQLAARATAPRTRRARQSLTCPIARRIRMADMAVGSSPMRVCRRLLPVRAQSQQQYWPQLEVGASVSPFDPVLAEAPAAAARNAAAAANLSSFAICAASASRHFCQFII